MTTLGDIAKKANVSIATVSRIINNKKSNVTISDSTRERVLAIARELGYQPNIYARALASKKTSMIGLVLHSIRDPFYNEVISGIEWECRQNCYNLVLSLAENSQIHETINMMINRNIPDGVIVCGAEVIDDKVREVINNNFHSLPFVSVSQIKRNIPGVDFDNYKGGYIATEYLISLGYRRLGVITGPDTDNSYARLRGYKQALKDHNIEPKSEYIKKGNFSYESGYKAMGKLLQLRCPPGAVFACDDFMALGAIRAIKDRKMRVPDDFSVMGFDNIIQTRYSVPKLTTISFSRAEMGRQAVKMLLNYIEYSKTDEKDKNNHFLFSPRLIKRESCNTNYYKGG